MKLKGKKTGETGYLKYDSFTDKLYVADINNNTLGEYDSLTKLIEEWEEVKELKGYWMINILGVTEYTHLTNDVEVEMMKKIGNYFETEEEAEKAVEKLKALERLKNEIGIRAAHYQIFTDGTVCVYFKTQAKVLTPYEKDLTLLFGDEK